MDLYVWKIKFVEISWWSQRQYDSEQVSFEGVQGPWLKEQVKQEAFEDIVERLEGNPKINFDYLKKKFFLMWPHVLPLFWVLDPNQPPPDQIHHHLVCIRKVTCWEKQFPRVSWVLHILWAGRLTPFGNVFSRMFVEWTALTDRNSLSLQSKGQNAYCHYKCSGSLSSGSSPVMKFPCKQSHLAPFSSSYGNWGSGSRHTCGCSGCCCCCE